MPKHVVQLTSFITIKLLCFDFLTVHLLRNCFIQLLWKTGLLYESRRLPVNMPSGHSGEVDV